MPSWPATTSPDDPPDLEQSLSRLAALALHATALAERTASLPSTLDRAARLQRLEDAAARSRAALLGLVADAVAGPPTAVR